MNQESQEKPVRTSARHVGVPEEVQEWRRQVSKGVLLAMALLGGLAVVGAVYDAYVGQAHWQIPIILGAYALLLIVTFWRRVPYPLQAGVLLFLVYGLGVFNLFISGQLGDGFPFLLTLPVLSALFFGRRVGTAGVVLASLTLVFFGVGFVSGSLVIPPDQVPTVGELGSWLSRILVFVMLALLLLLPLNFLFQRLADALAESRDLGRELEAQRAGLEGAVAARTADLARRSAQLETAAQVARDATAIQDVQQLLDETVHLVSDRFGFYHSGIFLLDRAGEYAVLRAASSEGGQQMLARGHKLKVGEEGLVGYVTRRGEPRIALDVGKDAVYFDNPDLPMTRSEVALPLRARDEVIGALDVQSTEQGAFGSEDVAVLQTLADQVAVAISNARLFQQVEESLREERRAYGELSLAAWRNLLRVRPDLGQRYDPHGILPPDGRWRAEMKQAIQVERPISGQDGTTATLAVPLKVRDQVIGVVDAHKPVGAGDWTEDEVAMLQALVDQLGVALDSARLHQDTQRRAIEDRLVGEITARMRQTLDVDMVLQTAVREMGKSLGIPRVEVRLGSEGGRTEDTQNQPVDSQSRVRLKETEHDSLG
jgi:GAF domain-containing protein